MSEELVKECLSLSLDEKKKLIARIIINQYRSSNSPFHTIFRKMQERCVYMGVGADINEAAIERINRDFVPRRER